MNQVVEKLMGLDKLTDPLIASDLMAAAKAGIKDYSIAITEAATPEVRNLLSKHLNELIVFQGELGACMISKGIYNAYDIPKQVQMDLQAASEALNLLKK